MLMDNPFKKIGHPPQPVPKELKKKVMEDVAAFQFFMELAGLFSINYAKATESFFKRRNRD